MCHPLSQLGAPSHTLTTSPETCGFPILPMTGSAAVQGRNASRSAKRPTSYLEPSLKEGKASKSQKHDEDYCNGEAALDDDGVDPFGPDGSGLGNTNVRAFPPLLGLVLLPLKTRTDNIPTHH
jgi:hypothetical protein